MANTEVHSLICGYCDFLFSAHKMTVPYIKTVHLLQESIPVVIMRAQTGAPPHFRLRRWSELRILTF